MKKMVNIAIASALVFGGLTASTYANDEPKPKVYTETKCKTFCEEKLWGLIRTCHTVCETSIVKP